MKWRKRLKAGIIYMEISSGRIGVLRRCEGVFRRKLNWELDFGIAVFPEELNRSHFRKTLNQDFVVIGEL